MSYWHEVMDDPQRLRRLASLLAWRALRQSVARGRAISLPNLLRLHERVSADLVGVRATDSTEHRQLAMQYLALQPFGGGPPTARPN